MIRQPLPDTPDGRALDLIVQAVRTWLDAGVLGALDRVLESPLHWAAVLRLALEHKVTPLLATVLCGPWSSACPEDVLVELRSSTRAIALSSLAWSRALGEVVALLRGAGVDVVAYKGALLAEQVYGNPALRDFGDLDILVGDWDYHHRVEALLTGEGWIRIADYGFERSYTHPRTQAVVDVHRSFTFPLWMPFQLDFATVRRRSVRCEVAGSAVRTLAPSDLLVVLCVQLAKDVGDATRTVPLIKLCDIAQFVRSQSGLDWDATLREARRLGVLHIVVVGLTAAADLLGCTMPREVERLNVEVPALGTLVRHVEERILGGPGFRYSRPEFAEPLTWNAALRERLRDRSRPVIYLRGSLFALSERDYAFVRLPRRLDPLYALVKPVRLLRKAGRRLQGMPAD